MPQPKHAMEVFQLLDKSNCRQCGEKTCLAFAGAVFRGQRDLRQCPMLSPEVVVRFEPDSEGPNSAEQSQEEHLDGLKAEIAGLDLQEAAERAGGRLAGSRLTLKVLGKDFGVDSSGSLITDIHVNPWVAIPVLTHLLHGRGLPAAGNWVSFRELKDGAERYPLFRKRCEEPMKSVADLHTGLFDDMVHIFNGQQVQEQFESDISVVLHPLPKVPLMVCYWLPEDGLQSSLNLFFDETADRNLDIGSIFTLGVGLAQMFQKLSWRHGSPRA
ncbi:MAG: Fe-S cluster protein [Deltaproteobacteria bacterium SG8_13]|nr:MAG: Fe-S cluster protein [Deltaproteobacteria bacterium SG8_13]